MKPNIILAVLPKLTGTLFLAFSLNVSSQEPYYRPRFNPFMATNEKGEIFDNLKTKAQRDSLVQVYIDEDWADGWHIPYYPGYPEWNCQDYSQQFWINFYGDTTDASRNGYDGFILDSIYAKSGTFYDNGKYGLPVLEVMVAYEDLSGHMMNAILTGDNALDWSDWNFIEPQRDQINLQPGDAYVPGVFFGRDTVDGALALLIPLYMPCLGNYFPCSTNYYHQPAIGFLINDGIPSLNVNYMFYELLITKRDYINPSIQITNPIDGQFYNFEPDLVYSFVDETLKSAWYTINGSIIKNNLYEDVYDFRIIGHEYCSPPDCTPEGWKDVYGWVPIDSTFGVKNLILSDGTYKLEVSAIDYFNHEATDTIQFTIDKTLPIANVTAPLPNYTYRQDTVRFIYEISEQNLDLPNSYYTFNGVKTSLSDNTGTIPLTSREGVNTVEIHIQDLATNVTIKTILYTLDTQSGVNDLQSTNEVVFYPNPVKDIGVFKFENEEKEPLKIELYDVSGRLLSHITCQTDLIKIDFSQYSSGIITYKVRNSKRTIKVGSIIKE